MFVYKLSGCGFQSCCNIPPYRKIRRICKDCAIIHVGINNILRHKDENELKNLPKGILKIANSCRNNNINKIFVSSILPSLRISIEIEKR